MQRNPKTAIHRCTDTRIWGARAEGDCHSVGRLQAVLMPVVLTVQHPFRPLPEMNSYRNAPMSPDAPRLFCREKITSHRADVGITEF